MYGNPEFLFGASENGSYYFSEKGLMDFFKKFDLKYIIRSLLPLKTLISCRSLHGDQPFNFKFFTSFTIR